MSHSLTTIPYLNIIPHYEYLHRVGVEAAAMLGAIPWILFSIPLASAMAEFFIPGPPPYPRWMAGNLQKIRYRTTYTEYIISLWQQLDGAGKLGPIIFRMFFWSRLYAE